MSCPLQIHPPNCHLRLTSGPITTLCKPFLGSPVCDHGTRSILPSAAHRSGQWSLPAPPPHFYPSLSFTLCYSNTNLPPFSSSMGLHCHFSILLPICLVTTTYCWRFSPPKVLPELPLPTVPSTASWLHVSLPHSHKFLWMTLLLLQLYICVFSSPTR